jgi:carboxyl-terminal processing protease
MTTRRLRRWLAGAALAAIVAACAAPQRPEDEAARLPSEANRVFAVVYDQIEDKYLRPIPLADVVGDGLAAVVAIDPALTLRRDGDAFELAGGDQPVDRFDIGRRDDPRGWSRLTVAAIDAARIRSATLRERSAEAVYQTFFDAALKRFDAFTRYNSQEAARDARAQRDGFGGIGITIDTTGGDVRVASVMAETPAARGGLKVDDRITGIAGTPTAGMNARDVVRRLRGPIGDTIAIEIKRTDAAATLTVTLVRAHIMPQTVTWRREGDVAIVRLTGFNHRTADALAETLAEAEKAIGPAIAGVVLDLRGNLGGLLDQSIAVADAFLADGTIVTTRGRHRGASGKSTAHRGDLGERMPLVVLVNGGSASASEIVAGALQDHRRAILLGTKSFGKGSVQTIIPMGNQGAIRLTTARYFTPSGRSIQAQGIEPDILVEQAKIEKIEAPRGRREADLRGALRNDQQSGQPAAPQAPTAPAADPDDAAAVPTDSSTDYQLARAFDLLRGLALYNTRVAN